MRNIILTIGLCGAMLPAAGANAAVLFHDDFSADVAAHGNALNFNDFINFTVSDGTVDLIAPTNPYGITCETGGCVDLDGSTSNAGVMTSKTIYDFLADVTYTITARVSGNQRNAASEYFTSGITGFGSGTVLITGSGFDEQTVMFQSSTAFSGRIFVGAEGGDNYGPVLASVTLSDDLPAVPLPASVLLFGGALAGLGALRRRKA